MPGRGHQADRTRPHGDLHPPAPQPYIRIRAGAERQDVVEARTRRAFQSAQQYSPVANSVKSEISVKPTIEFVS